MVQISGKYQHVANESFLEHLVGLGVPQEKAKALNETRAQIDITQEGSKVHIKSQTSTASTTLVVGQEVDETFENITVKSTTSQSGNNLTVVSKGDDGKLWTRVYKFSDSGLEVELSSSDSKVPKGKRIYKRA